MGEEISIDGEHVELPDGINYFAAMDIWVTIAGTTP
jgi:hypothetical protein